MSVRSPTATAGRRRGLVLWIAIGLLCVVGLASAIGRGIFLEDFGTRFDPIRQKYMAALDRDDPLASSRAEDLQRFDGRFGAHPFLAMLHIVPGGIILALAPFQFSARIRGRHLRFHRWSGRIVLVAGLIAGFSGLVFGLKMPFGGLGESAASAVFGGLFLVALLRAFVSIRRGDVARHREWMIRAFAIAVGTATVRLVAPAFDIALTPAGYDSGELFVLSLWTGWMLTLAGAELWIRHTRSREVVALA